MIDPFAPQTAPHSSRMPLDADVFFMIILLSPRHSCLSNFRRGRRSRRRRRGAPRFLLGACNVTPTPRNDFFFFGRVTFRGTVRTPDRCSVIIYPNLKLNYRITASGGFYFFIPYILIRNFCIISRRFNCAA